MKTAWAIRIDGWQYAGILPFITDQMPIRPCQDGMRTALFRTREEARLAYRRVFKEDAFFRRFWPKARVVKVEIDIREAK